MWQALVNLSNIGVAAAIPATLVPTALLFFDERELVSRELNSRFCYFFPVNATEFAFGTHDMHWST